VKLERINAAAQTELPKARPLKRNHSVSKISAPIPEKKSNPESTATRIPEFASRCETSRARAGGSSTFIVDLHLTPRWRPKTIFDLQFSPQPLHKLPIRFDRLGCN